MNINNQSLQTFLADRGNASQNRLYVKNKELHYDEDIGCMTLFAAKLGFGGASMSNVAKFIRKNQDTCFSKNTSITKYNDFVASYNDKQSICWKKAKKIKQIVNKRPVLSRDEAHQFIKDHIDACKLLIKDPAQHPLLVKTCGELKEVINEWSLDGDITKEEKKTLNAVLELKNQIRNSFFPTKAKALKGNQEPQILTSLSDDDKNTLRTDLKDIRKRALKKYFSKRLKADGEQLTALKNRFQKHGSSNFSEAPFLKDQLDRWQKKLDQGKPIAIPKWYHCTKEADTMDAILKTDILFMQKQGFAGAFVSNHPEYNPYGSYCFMLSEHIEKTGTKQQGSTHPLFPKESTFYGDIRYADAPQIANNLYVTDHQSDVGIWLGFQRGKHTFDPVTLRGTEGIPMHRNEKIQRGNLEYYKDTSVGFITNRNNDPALTKIGQDRRVQVITYSQSEALRTLINATFHCTLPLNWEGNIKAFT